jgi:hypothetical protein
MHAPQFVHHGRKVCLTDGPGLTDQPLQPPPMPPKADAELLPVLLLLLLLLLHQSGRGAAGGARCGAIVEGLGGLAAVPPPPWRGAAAPHARPICRRQETCIHIDALMTSFHAAMQAKEGLPAAGRDNFPVASFAEGLANRWMPRRA